MNWYPECPICAKCMKGAGWDFNLWHSKKAYDLIDKYQASGYLSPLEAWAARQHVECVLNTDQKTALEFARIEDLEIDRAIQRIRARYAD